MEVIQTSFIQDGEFLHAFRWLYMFNLCVDMIVCYLLHSQPVISSAGNSRKLERNGMEREAKTRELRHQQNMPKLEALLERQKRMEKLMLSSTKRPPVNNAYLKPRQMV